MKSMLSWLRRRWRGVTIALAIVVAISSWPIPLWLQHRNRWLDDQQLPDALYLVAGARDQNRRLAAIAQWCDRTRRLRRPRAPLPLLIGNDSEPGPYSAADRATLSMAQWAVRKAQQELTHCVRPVRLDGSPRGTDGEMEILADHLRRRPDLDHIGLATSAYHIRRTLWRLRHYASRHDLRLSALPIGRVTEDYTPWTALGELAKMGRDALGLSRHQLMSRGPLD